MSRNEIRLRDDVVFPSTLFSPADPPPPPPPQTPVSSPHPLERQQKPTSKFTGNDRLRSSSQQSLPFKFTRSSISRAKREPESRVHILTTAVTQSPREKGKRSSLTTKRKGEADQMLGLRVFFCGLWEWETSCHPHARHFDRSFLSLLSSRV